MVSCNRSDNWAGGDGCTGTSSIEFHCKYNWTNIILGFPLIPTLLKPFLDKVSPVANYPECISSHVSIIAVGGQNVACAPVEFVKLNPPSGQTCGDYMQRYISRAGGYLTNPDATSTCEFCSVRTTDQFLGANFNIKYSHHWRDLGFVLAFVLFNVSHLCPVILS
jgi:ABC-type multidrug transport system permease subunit